ncbi:hypothetical protein RIF23_07275 [Lipingzhangella sp. LS1_29]|uniref:Uncharacterized protein n=1 Tax=Lipingzhangella rawalii TaxID=2055835 RepID=A0ABU2H517_9ACTN|nr:hypothetical protein [Lipingzhangella rawalii]MDS1270092.1 hypothetical protein [Lipingzhangella rawalii]
MGPDMHTASGLHDDVALAEITLYTEVLAAVAGTDAALSQERIDEILGVTPGVGTHSGPTGVCPPRTPS